jgi:hypothetical protein
MKLEEAPFLEVSRALVVSIPFYLNSRLIYSQVKPWSWDRVGSNDLLLSLSIDMIIDKLRRFR